MTSLARLARIAGVGGAVAGTAVVAAVAANPVVRDELRRVARMARPLGVRPPADPVPPVLPPGRVVDLPGRGEVFVRDTGAGVSPDVPGGAGVSPDVPGGAGVSPDVPGGAGVSPEVTTPPVLLLHGWTVSADLNWFTSYDELAEAYRVVALDHRGHGRGMRSEQAFSLEDCADDAAALLRALGAAPAVVVGFSMGGPIALLLWSRHPDAVAGLVFCGTALEWHASARERIVWRGMSLFEVALRSGTGDGMVGRVLRETIEESPDLEPLQPWVTGEFHRGYPADLAGAGRALAAYDGRPLAPGVDVPSAVVVTTRDQLVRPVKQRQLADALRAPVFELDADHLAPFNRPKQFSRAIRTAVDDVAARITPPHP